MNLAPALAALPRRTLTLLSNADGTWVKGRYVAGAESKRTTFKSVVQPFPEKKLHHFPHGEEAHGAQLLHTTRRLDTTNEELQTQADRVLIPGFDGVRFKIASVGDWSQIGRFFRYAAVMEAVAS